MNTKVKKSFKERLQEKKQAKQYRKENNIPTLWTYIKPFKSSIFAYIALSILYIIFSTADTLIVAQTITLITEGRFSQALYYIIYIIILNLLLRFDNMLSSIIFCNFQNKFVSNLNRDLSMQAFKFNATTYSNNPSGTFVQRIIQDPMSVVQQLVSIVDIITSVINFLIIFIYIIYLNYIMGLMFVLGFVLLTCINKSKLKTWKKKQKISNQKSDKIYSLTTEIVKSERDIKSLGLENKLSELTTEKYNDLNTFNRKKYITHTYYNTAIRLTNVLTEIFAMAVGIALLDHSLITIATFMIIYTNSSNFRSLGYQVSNLQEIFTNIKIYSERMFNLFDNKKFPIETFGTIDAGELKGRIEFKKVGYAYSDKLSKIDNSKELNDEYELSENKKVLNNLSFKIKANTTVTFVGKSGSGKSTILSLMSKMYTANEGQVLLDGIDIKDLTKECLRNNISLVNQFPYIFDLSIRENLLMAKADATEQELKEAIDKSYLSDFIDNLPNGIDTVVGESGIKLSGGQRQRLAIARALLRKSSIILFDESTSSLDNYAQGYIKKSIDGLKGSSTIVIVAHRLSTIRNVDKIYFLDEGKIIDSGTFDELYENNEMFKNMFLAENI